MCLLNGPRLNAAIKPIWDHLDAGVHKILGGGNSILYFLIFTPICWEMIQFDLRIFFKWVGEKPPTRIIEDEIRPALQQRLGRMGHLAFDQVVPAWCV